MEDDELSRNRISSRARARARARVASRNRTRDGAASVEQIRFTDKEAPITDLELLFKDEGCLQRPGEGGAGARAGDEGGGGGWAFMAIFHFCELQLTGGSRGSRNARSRNRAGLPALTRRDSTYVSTRPTDRATQMEVAQELAE